MKMKLAFIFGTRPEIIKLSSTIRYCIRKNIDFFTVHTGQHYSYSMSKLFLEELELPEPDYKLKIKSKAPYRQGDHTGRMMVKLEDILLKEMPSTVFVQGDTNSTLAGALTTSKISTTRAFTGFNMKLAHVEAGLRSYDRNMPEEINRVIADHLSDYLFAPTKQAGDTAVSENVDRRKVFVTGNTIVDALYHCVELGERRGSILSGLGLEKGGYMLLTLHRQENVDNKKKLNDILKGVGKSSRKLKVPVIFPAHPRTVKKMDLFGIKPSKSIHMIKPSGFIDFLQLEAGAQIVFSDSGGVQEETCVLGVPCVTLRESTERPETVSCGANIVAGVSSGSIERSAEIMAGKKRNWKNPFGKGNSAEKIMKVVCGMDGRDRKK